MFALDSRPTGAPTPLPAVVPRQRPPANLPDAPQPRGSARTGLASALLAAGALPAQALVRALALHKSHGGRLEDLLVAHNLVSAPRLYAVLGRLWNVPVIDLAAEPPDPRLIDRIGAPDCLRMGAVPWRTIGGQVVLVVAHPDGFAAVLARVGGRLGPVAMAIAPAKEVEAAVLRARGARLAHAAARRVEASLSCRDWERGKTAAAVLAFALLVLLSAWLAWAWTFDLLLGWTVLTMMAGTAVKAAALLLRPTVRAMEPPPPGEVALPVVSVLVALYREAGIAGRLVRRLERLDYPRDLLDVMLVVEESDMMTRDALAAAALPPWMRVVTVPDGPVRTKPRALNYALDLCRGSIVGVYDAEDAPAPDQIARVVERFRTAGPRVACLQGVLDFYNPHANWMSRCFALEYAGWFRVVLPGLSRLGMPVPLGGTTLFFRRDVLEKLGAWDAFNVTEDADLGMRLVRQGYVTELIDTVTHEEACCHPWPWVKQRSRWIKGYMMTLVVHMRHPLRLWRDLGPRGFLGFQVLFVATLSQFLLAPLLWLCWLAPTGLFAVPLAPAFMPWFVGMCLTAEAVNLAVAWRGRRRAGFRLSMLWALAMHAYFPLATAAAYKALWELMLKPFYWDKTSHGVAGQTLAGQRVRNSPASTRRRVS